MIEEPVERESRPRWTRTVAILVAALIVLIVGLWVYTTFFNPGAGKPPGKGGPGIELGTSQVKLQPLTIPPLEFVPVIQMQRPTLEPGTQPRATAEPGLQPNLSGEFRCVGVGGFSGYEIRYYTKGGFSGGGAPLEGECAGQGSEAPQFSGPSSLVDLAAGDTITISFALTTTTGAKQTVMSAYEMWTDGELYER